MTRALRRWRWPAAALLATAVILATTLAPLSSGLSQSDDLVLFVIDFQSIVRRSEAAESVRDQIAEMREAYQEEFGVIESDLRTLETELTDLRDTLSADEFTARRRGFEERVIEAQRAAQARRAALDEAFNTAMQTVRTTLVEIVTEMAEQRNADIVLDRSQVVLVDQALEASDEALDELNRRLPSVTVVLPAEPGNPTEGR